jgi:tetratricopeptide (TPR) repeat protein
MSRYLFVVLMLMVVVVSTFGSSHFLLIPQDQLPKMKSDLEQLLAKTAWNEAYGVSVKLWKLIEADQPMEPLVKAECYDLVSQAHHRTFRLREACHFSEKAIALRRLERQKDKLRVPSDSFAQSLYDLGLRYVLLEESSKAAEAFAESLALLNQDKKGTSPLLVDLHLELSRVHLSQGDVETAQNRLNAAQEVLNKLTPPDPQRTADVRLQLGVHHLSLHDFRQAADYLKSAGVYFFAKKEKTLGEMCERFHVLLLQNTLLCMKGQFESASKSIERVLSVLVPLKAKWNDYPSFVELEAMYRFQLAVAKLGCQDANGAEEEFRKVVQLEESQTVSWSHVCALARVHIAQIVGQKKGRSKEAMELLGKALTVQHSLLQEGYNFQSDVQRLQFTIKMRSALDAYLSLAVKDQAEATKMYAQVLRWKTAVYSRNNRDRRQGNAISSKTYGETQRELLDAAASVRTWEAATPTAGSSPQVDQQWIDRGVVLRDQRLALERKMAALLKDAKGQDSESHSVSPEQLAMLVSRRSPLHRILLLRPYA